MNLYIDIGTRYIPNIKTCSVYHWNQNRNKAEKMQFIAVEVFIYLFIWLQTLFVCVKDRTCLRMAILAYCFSICGSIFDALFSLLFKKLILECDTIWQSLRKFLWAVWSVTIFPHMDKEETFFLENYILIWSEFFIPFH